MKIDLPIEWSWGSFTEWKIVEAEIVDVAPHLATIASFAVSKSHDSFQNRYKVHNIETGCSVMPSRKTKKEAVFMARKYLRSISRQKLTKRYEQIQQNAGGRL